MRSQSYLLIVGLCLCVLVLTVLTSCGTDTGSSVQRNFRQGILSPDITNPLPQEKVYEGRPLYVPFQFVNNAAYPLNHVVVTYTQIDETFVNVYNKEYPLSGPIEGVNQFSPIPEPYDIALEGDIGYLQTQTGESFRDIPYRIKAKFDSTFTFNPTVCIGSSSGYDFETGSGCKIGDDPSSFSGQGAPVGVVKMEQISYGQFGPQIEFRMTVANRGPGELLSLKIQGARIGNDALRCVLPDSPDPESVTLKLKPDQKETTVLCVYDIGAATSYRTPLLVDFSYEYEFSEKYNLKIIRTGRIVE
ncbi:hypothetical protein HYV86_04985 [Candidatus Woesearchaeota archaeon]|nr:hypothetical protein [Candidatus Woesearchaeota archaeon]